MNKPTRNTLRNTVTQCRRLLEAALGQELAGRFGIYATGAVDDAARMGHLSAEEREYREQLLVHLEHIRAGGFKPADAMAQLVREVAFTHLNRLVAYKMMEARGLIREAVSRGPKSQGFLFYLADHPADEALWSGGQAELAYRHFLTNLGAAFADEIPALFSPTDPANHLYPSQRTLDEALALINGEELAGVWAEDETIGWVYQYFTPKELRDQARKESQAPRNSYELAFRNQFYTPRYVVEFLSDNTLGRIWYEMRQGQTALVERCRYMVRRPVEVFLAQGAAHRGDAESGEEGLSQEALLKTPVYISYREKKDPREILMLDPAGGSGHFGLYCFDLFETIYAEAYDDPDLGKRLRADYPHREAYRRAIPGLILAHNIHIIDIDPRACQIAALALWLRAQRAYQEMDLKPAERPAITKANVVCAEPMPGERELLAEFTAELDPPVLGQLVAAVFEKMTLAGEAGSLLKIEEELWDVIAAARAQWAAGPRAAQLALWPDAEPPQPKQLDLFDVSGISDEAFWTQAEGLTLAALRDYAEHAAGRTGLRRRLFADDAARGFAFVDLCQKRYDVALMNPPFGAAATASQAYIEKAYLRTKNDVYAAFVERWLGRLSEGGRLGAITSRTGFFLSSFQKWREEVLLRDARPVVFADLGYGVLDTAMVETAAYCLCAGNTKEDAIFFRLLAHEDKRSVLSEAVDALRQEQGHSIIFRVDPASFRQVPGAPFAYWVSEQVLQLYRDLPSFESDDRTVKQGLATADDFRFVRAWWEVLPHKTIAGTHGTSLDEFHKQTSEGRRWVLFAKGGEYQPYYADVHLVVNWERDGHEIKSELGDSGRPRSNVWMLRDTAANCFFRPGLTWPLRTNSNFGLRVLPAGCIFGHKGPTGFVPREHLACALGVLFSKPYQALLEMSLAAGDETQSGTPSRSYEVGIVKKLPWPTIDDRLNQRLANEVVQIIDTLRKADRWDETSHVFAPSALQKGRLWDDFEQWLRQVESQQCSAIELASDIDVRVAEVLGVNEADRERVFGRDAKTLTRFSSDVLDGQATLLYEQSIHDTIRDELDESGGNRQIAVKSFYVSRHLEVLALTLGANPRSIAQFAAQRHLLPLGYLGERAQMWLSCLVGFVLGRWDVRAARDETLYPVLPSPFDPLPVCPPATLVDPDGLPATPGHIVSEAWLRARPDAITLPPPGAVAQPTIPDSEYPLRIDWDGILVDDPDHADDIVRRVRDVLELLWGERAGAIEQEACEILGACELRDYFRKPAAGGFWLDHVRRYSKSRRKAPIYWLLQSSKKNYGLWLYYHRLDKDLLFKALVNYVEPKIRLEEGKLEGLRGQRATFGTSGREVKQLERQLDRQEAFLAELHDFRDKLRRAADLRLEPDLNDGVILNIAPLWELAPWKEAKATWEELLAGKYEWSAVGKQLRAKGVVK